MVWRKGEEGGGGGVEEEGQRKRGGGGGEEVEEKGRKWRDPIMIMHNLVRYLNI